MVKFREAAVFRQNGGRRRPPLLDEIVMKYLIALFSLIVLALVLAGGARANGFGIALDQPAGEYIANVDYDANGLFLGAPVQFAFQLFTKDRSETVEIDDVWVTIIPTGAQNANYMPPFLDVGIIVPQSSIVPPGMTFTFPYGGSYDLKVRFDKGGTALAEASFPLTVGGAEEKTVAAAQNRLINLLLLGATITVMVLEVLFFFRGERERRRKRA